jgi:hypothetical protein
LASKRFHLVKYVFHGLRFVSQNQVSEIGFKIFGKSFGLFGSGFFAKFVFSGKVIFLQSLFLAKVSVVVELVLVPVETLPKHKFSVLRFGKSVVFSKAKVGLVKICGACKIKSVKGVVLVFRRRVF